MRLSVQIRENGRSFNPRTKSRWKKFEIGAIFLILRSIHTFFLHVLN